MRFSAVPFVAALMLCWGGSARSLAEEQLQYHRDVLPILARSCFPCHGPDAGRREAELRLDDREAAMAERNGTRAIVPGQTQQSELIRRVDSSDPDQVMPPPGSVLPLAVEERQLLKRWIEAGAAYEPHWALVPPGPGRPPAAPGLHHAIDAFIVARLHSVGLTAAPLADRRTLLRRASLDLVGLPPLPEETTAFLSDSHPDAWPRAVDRLLASPHFGERWGRWWLDLAHYADSDGYLQDFHRPQAWRYRDWVVDVLNGDMPFDRFTVEQLAGDLLPDAATSQETTSQKIATGFLRNTLSNREGGADLEEFRVRQVVDRTQSVGVVWLALSVGCAECHDHKFDPITQRDFYQLYAFFNDADEVNVDAPLRGEAEQREAARASYDSRRRALLAPLADEINVLQKQWEARILHAELNPGADHRWDRQREVLGLVWGQGLGEGQLEGLHIVQKPWEHRTPAESERLMDYFLKNGELVDPKRFAELRLADVSRSLDELGRDLPMVSRAPTMVKSAVPRVTRVHQRGDFRRPGEAVAAATPTIFGDSLGVASSDRLQLARWLVQPHHPLTSRVVVNRLWQELFGQGIVTTSENFGVRGERPSHPELLDWLARDFVSGGWSIKRTLRRMVLSETYQQSSRARPEVEARDPRNTLLARQARLRLPAELIRDSGLTVSGLLVRQIGGPCVRPPQPTSVSMEGFDNRWMESTGGDRYRRGLYTFLQRTSPFAQLVTFDLPDLSRSCTRRERSNTPLQSLLLLNDPVFLEMAHALALRMLDASPGEGTLTTQQEAAGLARGFLLTIQRQPSSGEQATLQAYLQRQRTLFSARPEEARRLLAAATGGPMGEAGEKSRSALPEATVLERASWTMVASVLLNLDEALVRD